MLDALAEHGLRVPADMSVAGYTTPPWRPWGAISLTTVGQFAAEIAAEAMRSVLARIDRRDRPARHVMVSSPYPTCHHRTLPRRRRDPGSSLPEPVKHTIWAPREPCRSHTKQYLSGRVRKFPGPSGCISKIHW